LDWKLEGGQFQGFGDLVRSLENPAGCLPSSASHTLYKVDDLLRFALAVKA